VSSAIVDENEIDASEVEVVEAECQRVILEEIAVINDWVSAMESHLDQEQDNFASLCDEAEAVGSAQCGEECKALLTRDLPTTAGCAGEFDFNESETTECEMSNAEPYFQSGGRPRK
jgi:hypothetical protein